jgi:D-alanine-D-alanine ligase
MKTKLALLCGGISREDYLSRRSCQVLYQVLDTTKFDLYILDWQQDGSVLESTVNSPDLIRTTHPSILHCFANFSGDVVVNLIHGEKENCGEIQGLLELAHIPYTGNGLSASVEGMVKTLTKRCFTEIGVKTPAAFLFRPRRKEDRLKLLGELRSTALHYPLILKPVKGGSSIGIQLVHNETELQEFLAQLGDLTPYLFEEFIEGTEYSVGVFATHSSPKTIVLPIARIDHEGDYFDAQIKFNDTYRVVFPTDIPRIPAEGMRQAAIRIHETIGFSGFSRCDFIVRGDDFFALEVNTHPGMSAYSIVPNMVKQAQLSLGDFFEQMIREAQLQRP